MLTYGVYYFFFVRGNTINYEYFTDLNVSQKFHDNFFSVFKGPLRVFKYSFQLFPLLFPCLIFSIITLIKFKQYRSNLLFKISFFWSFFSLAGFSASNYAAPRYFLVLIVPIALIVPLTVKYFEVHSSWKKFLFLSVFILSILISFFRIAFYWHSPSFSFINMAKQVETYLYSKPEHSQVLMGHFADSLALAAKIESVNDRMGFQTLPYRIEKFNPGYYISIGEIDESIAPTLKQYYQLNLLKKFDVYQNHDYGKAVFFYELIPKNN